MLVRLYAGSVRHDEGRGVSAHVNGFVTNLTGGLARLFCKRCKEETIHRGLKCTRSGCGATHVAYPVRSVYSRGIGVTPRNHRGIPNGGYPIVMPGSRPAKVVVK